MSQILVLVASPTLAAANDTKARLESALDVEVLATRESEVARVVAAVRPHVVVTASDAIELLGAIHDVSADVPVVVLADGLDEGRAIANGAAALVTNDAPDAELASVITRLGAQAAGDPLPVVLAIGAHPDDVEAGVGGILAAHRAAGHPVTILTLSVGSRPGAGGLARSEGEAAAAVLGADLVTIDEREVTSGAAEQIARVVADLQPTIVYTHSDDDLRPEHRAVHAATLAATEGVETVACYHGTTGSPAFTPTEVVAIDDHLSTKLAALACFAVDETPAYLEPDFVVATARHWAQYGTGTHGEPLDVLRGAVTPAEPA